MVAFGCGDAISGGVPFGLDAPGRADGAAGPRACAPSQPLEARREVAADAVERQ
jgi:hypothetical protein